MNQKDINLANRLKLSAQRALLGAITPNIRTIFVELIDDDIQIYFYYDGVVQEDDEENASIVSSEIIADFDDEFDINLVIKQVDYPMDIIQPSGMCVYYRKEVQ
ncbi:MULTISPECIES: hypothetical protein [Providencia]|uniref:hypothetical protein n=1 Tax=Providencia TaxID=586 RepID=UPI0008FB1640|nr:MULTISPECIES: hypothetical protein [Providencia]APC10566.1 hypothetical protein RB151_008610 [Providencia rettgeri]AVL74186.1 hypothetical protein CEQ08_10775 [Providencia rettgeri]EKH6498873.1 hypothetical protein [Providencia rettgeri]ELR5053585.1 hypothetical protein [Providencia rettgeri]ELR5138644.1 hypothetical protein [Providencia rettgeri]